MNKLPGAGRSTLSPSSSPSSRAWHRIFESIIPHSLSDARITTDVYLGFEKHEDLVLQFDPVIPTLKRTFVKSESLKNDQVT